MALDPIVSHGLQSGMRVETTEVYRDWVNALKDRAGQLAKNL